MLQKGKLKAEEKVEIVRKYERGEVSLGEAARHAGVGQTTIRGWIARYKAEGANCHLTIPLYDNETYQL